MKSLIHTLILTLLVIGTASAQKPAELQHSADQVVRYWDNTSAPHSNEETADEEVNQYGDVSHTSRTDFFIFKANKEKNRHRCIVVLPGGGYSRVCISKEGFNIAQWLRDEGITAIVVKYRLPNNGHKEVPLEDAQAALRYAREHAKELDIDPTKVGIMGSSAGGHLAAYTSTFTPDAEKPAFAVLFYPVITGTTWQTHMGTFNQLLGTARTAELTEYYSLENRVTATTPPTILLLSDDDLKVPPINSTRYYDALKRHGVKSTMYIFPTGGHGWAGKTGFAYEKEYKHLLLEWLDSLKK